MYNQVSSKCSLTLQVKAWQYNDRDNYKIEIKEHINYVWIANYQEEIEIEDGIVDNFSNPLNNRNGYHNSIVSENVLLLWFISIYSNHVVSKSEIFDPFHPFCCFLLSKFGDFWSPSPLQRQLRKDIKTYLFLRSYAFLPINSFDFSVWCLTLLKQT